MTSKICQKVIGSVLYALLMVSCAPPKEIDRNTYFFVPGVRDSNPTVTNVQAFCDQEIATYRSLIAEGKEPPIDLLGNIVECKEAGRVIVVGVTEAAGNALPSLSIASLTYDEANEHMQDAGVPWTSGDGHDELVSLPQLVMPNWVSFESGVKRGSNGCGVFAAAICNRRLGLTAYAQKPQISQEEWEELRSSIGSKYLGGATPLSFTARYYGASGYCTEYKTVAGTCADYAEMKQKLNEGCAVQFYFAQNAGSWFSSFSTLTSLGGMHIEGVVDVQADASRPGECYATTNSWGAPAYVYGGTAGDFIHSRNKDYNAVWPPNCSTLWASYICKCDSTWPTISYLGDLVKNLVGAK